MSAIAKITAKGQTTVPAEVRAALYIQAGDLIVWEPQADGSARVRRVQPLELDYLHAIEGTLTEWNSPADDQAYREL